MSTTTPRPPGRTAVDAGALAGLLGPGALHPPLYESLAQQVRGLVADGRLGVGVRLPAEREVAAALGLSRVTASAAYRLLRDQGWAQARRGAGTWTSLPGASGVVAAFVPADDQGVLDLSYASPPGPPEVLAAVLAAHDALPRHLAGHGYAPQGLAELRARVAERYAARGVPTTPEQVVVTAGATGAISAALGALVGAGDRVLHEHPVWPGALDVLRSLGAQPVPVPRPAGEAHGFAAAAHRAARQTGARAAYVVPDFSNPTGAVLGEDERRSLVVSLQQQGVVVVADEALADLRLDGPPGTGDGGGDDGSGGTDGTPLAACGRPGAVVSAGSLSKSVWAGVRVGWLRAERAWLDRVVATSALEVGSLSLVDQLVACSLLDGYEALLAHRRAGLRAQRDALVAALARHLPEWEVPVPAGGQSLWCRLPEDVSSSVLVDAAEEVGLRLATGSRFGVGHAFDDRLRLPFTAPVADLERAVALLVLAVERSAGRAPRARRPVV